MDMHKYIDEHRDAMVSDLKTLLRIPSVEGEPQPGAPFGSEVRRALDALSVELACDRINDEELAALGKACESFEKAVSTGEPKKIAQADVEFHNIIVKAAGNTRLVQLINNLSEQMYRYRFEYIKDVSTHEQLIAEHRILFDCIRNKDKATAAKTAKLHIDNQENAIMRQLHKEQEKNAAHA